MSPILQALLDSTLPRGESQPLKAHLERFLLYENQIVEQLGWDFTTDLENAWNDLHAAEVNSAYERGFLAAFRLWMEVAGLAGGL